MKYKSLLTLAGCFLSMYLPAQEIQYGTGRWNRDLYGNHRVVLRVDTQTDAVRAHIPWRRRDTLPEKKDLILVDASSGKEVANLQRININDDYGDIVFQPVTGPGIYYLYYMPYRMSGKWWLPDTRYLPARQTCDTGWLRGADLLPGGNKAATLPAARVLRFEAINDFNRFYPMEMVATQPELDRLLRDNSRRDFLVFPEDRKFPIRMTDAIPERWIKAGVTDRFEGVALRNEFYVFQLGLFAPFRALKNVRLRFSALAAKNGNSIPAASVRCFNLGGKDWLGNPFVKQVNVPKGNVQALWIGVDIAAATSPGDYTGEVTVEADGATPQAIKVRLRVKDAIIPNRGYDELFRQARLNWLDSGIGLDDSVFRPFIPVALTERTVHVLGRSLTFANTGFPEKITSSFSAGNNDVRGAPRDILSEPVHFDAILNGRKINWTAGKPAIREKTSGAVAWEAVNRSPPADMKVHAKMECDGYVNYEVTLTAKKAVTFDDLRLVIPYASAVSAYMMGMGRKGGRRPSSWQWKWEEDRANNMIWIGDVNAGMQCKLKNVTPDWKVYGFEDTGPYKDWSNDGRGGCDLEETASGVQLRAYTGRKTVHAGEVLHFNFGLLITPVKTLDKAHWTQRYFQSDPPASAWLKKAEKGGANIINIHQGNELNPYINYPFIETGSLKQFVQSARSEGIRSKIYYTIRELSVYTAELWALRSLNGEIFTQGQGRQLADQFTNGSGQTTDAANGGSWEVEHLVKHYDPAWHNPLPSGEWDMSIRTTGLSRWHNYYLEGLNWLVKKTGIKGLYLDGIGYDREIMKRVRKVLDRAADSCLIDFHSGNNFSAPYGMNSPANQYMELFPCINSLWLGEGYDYNETPDYWLVEISGIPFGLYSEMLNGCGNAWRGMLYGMSSRLGWTGCDPSAIWKLWDAFGIRHSVMKGYWEKDNPVTCADSLVKVTVYQKADEVMVAYASWSARETTVDLRVNWKQLGLQPGKVKITAPAIEGLQSAKTYTSMENIPVPGSGGGILIIKKMP